MRRLSLIRYKAIPALYLPGMKLTSKLVVTHVHR